MIIAALLMLAACQSLPRIAPDRDSQSVDTIQIKGESGILTAQQSQAMLDKFKNHSSDNLILEKHLALEQAITGAPLVAGNQLTLLIDGPATYASMFLAMRDARDHINMETYIFENDDIGRQFAALLIDKQKHGVQVHLMVDSVGTLNTPRAFFQPLIDAGIQVLEFNPLNPTLTRKGWELNQRDHRKLLIVDGKIAFVGGINISSVYTSGLLRKRKPLPQNKDNVLPWRDTQIRMEGPVVAEFQKMFLSTWEKQQGPKLSASNYYPRIPPIGTAIVRGIASSPDDAYSGIYATLISAIRHAESKIYLTNAYFIPDPQLLTALKEAVKRGVDVRLLLPSKSDSALVLYASRSFYTELLQNGIQIYERQDALLHAKTALIDGVWSTIGSTNLDWRSFVYNQEINAVILGQQFGNQMQAMFARDLANSTEITWEAWKNRPMVERMKEFGAGLWTRWL